MASPEVLKVEQKILDRLEEELVKSDGENQKQVLLLVGCANTVVGAVKLEGETWGEAEITETLVLLPVGLTVLGVCYLGGGWGKDLQAKAESSRRAVPRELLKQFGSAAEFFFYFVTTTAAEAYCLFLDSGKLAELQPEVLTVPEGVKASSGYLRCKLDLSLQLVYSPTEASEVRSTVALDKALEREVQHIQSNSFEFLYKKRLGEEEGEEEDFETAFFHMKSLDQITEERQGQKAGTFESPLELELYASSSSAAATPVVAPILRYEPTGDGKSFECEVIDVHLDVLVMLSRASSFDLAMKRNIISKMIAQLQAMKKEVVAYPRENCFKVNHYSPEPLSFALSLIYPDVVTDEAKLLEKRKGLHEKLLLPLDRPLLRLSNALTWGEGNKSFSNKLLNVHLALKSSGVKDGKQYLVKGRYCYFHYMQDRFDDAGWGCAYRSLQTIVSWFVLNNYSHVEIPGHRDIQQTLVNIGDKQPTFVGSKQWIGAIEISFILDTLLDVSSKVITFNSGGEIPSKAREIAHHFETQGTPIMIGGGVLAYTLLGIDYNESTGECAFLILDPHYTEGENIDKICSGSWVGWKRLGDSAAAGGDLFVKTAFYNFLCPQRPNTV